MLQDMPAEDDVPGAAGDLLQVLEDPQLSATAGLACLPADIPARGGGQGRDPLPDAAAILEDPSGPLIRGKIETSLDLCTGVKIIVVNDQFSMMLAMIADDLVCIALSCEHSIYVFSDARAAPQLRNAGTVGRSSQTG
jgi:hypothetical protein